MELAKCYLESTKLKLSFQNDDETLRVFTNKIANFKIQIIDVFPFQNPNDSSDYSVMIKTKNLTTNVEKEMDLETLNEHYY